MIRIYKNTVGWKVLWTIHLSFSLYSSVKIYIKKVEQRDKKGRHIQANIIRQRIQVMTLSGGMCKKGQHGIYFQWNKHCFNTYALFPLSIIYNSMPYSINYTYLVLMVLTAVKTRNEIICWLKLNVSLVGPCE